MIYIFLAVLIMPLCGVIARAYFPDNQDFWTVASLILCTYLAGIFGYKGITEFDLKKFQCTMLSYEWAKEHEIHTVYVKNTEGGIDVILLDWDNDLVYKNGRPYGKPFHNEFNDTMDIYTLFLDYTVYETLSHAAENKNG